MPKSKCKICNSHKIVKINLSKKKSLTSDGNIINNKLYKYKCSECGLFFNPKKYEIINYKRSSGSSKWEKIRHQNIAKGISKIYQDYISYKKNTLKF